MPPKLNDFSDQLAAWVVTPENDGAIFGECFPRMPETFLGLANTINFAKICAYVYICIYIYTSTICMLCVCVCQYYPDLSSVPTTSFQEPFV